MKLNWDQIKGDWKQLRGKLKEKWQKLSDEDLASIGGKRDRLIDLLQKRYQFSKEIAELELDQYIRQLTS